MSIVCRRKRGLPAAGWLRTWLLLVLLLAPALAWLPPRSATAQDPPAGNPPARVDTALAAKLRQRGDLTLSDTPLRQALFTVGQTWGINLVVGDEVQGNVNGVFQDAPLHEILHAILYANGFGYQVVGQSLAVMRLDALGDMNPLFQTATIGLQAVQPEDVVAGARLLSSPQGKIQAIGSARSLMVIDLPERVQQIRQFAQQLDQAAALLLANTGDAPSQLKVSQFAPQFITAESLSQAIQPLLSQHGKVSVVTEENRLVIVEHPDVLRMIADLVQQLDVPRPQVRITALIYDVSVEAVEQLGLNWSNALKDRIRGEDGAQSLLSVDSVMHMPAGAGDPSSLITLMNLSQHMDVTAVMKALSQTKESRLLADPSVTVVDRAAAKIQIVTEVPFQQLTQSGFGGQIGTTAFRDAGVTLSVTPHIANDGTVQLNVTPTFSRLTGFTTGPTPMPIIDKREAETTVRVANQQTLVIGGLRQRNDVDEVRGVPWLKDIKRFSLGRLFQFQDTSTRESELIVFITPEIVTPLHSGTAREKVTYQVGRSILERIPPARDEPPCPVHDTHQYEHEWDEEEIETPIPAGPVLEQPSGRRPRPSDTRQATLRRIPAVAEPPAPKLPSFFR